MRISGLRYIAVVNVLIAGGFVTWAVVSAIDGTSNQDVHSVAPWKPEIISLPSDASKQLVDTAILTEAMARPLFERSRRPFVAKVVIVAEAEDIPAPPEAPPPPRNLTPDGLIVRGLLISATQSQVLISTSEAPDGVWFAPGAILNGWTVHTLDADGATLIAGTQHIKLKLFVDNTTIP